MEISIQDQLVKTPPLDDSLGRAHIWLSQGFRVLPCQPGKKYLVAGYGPNLADLKTTEELEFWFKERKANLAVVCPPGSIILDFDDLGLYADFCEQSPESAFSYTETTPRGFAHIFLRAENDFIPRWASIVPKLEIKKFALVYPSRVEGKRYRVTNSGKIITVNLEQALKGFARSEPSKGSRTRESASVDGPGVNWGHPRDQVKRPLLISNVKAKWSILLYLATFEPNLKLIGNSQSRYFRGLCPWHEDHEPSLWVDSELQLWGCFSCGAHGDVVDWHERRFGFPGPGASARDLANRPGGVSRV